MKKATLFRKLEDKKVQCLACSHYCTILPGYAGICGVRQNIKGELYLLVYGKPTISVDPVEKKPLFHFLPGKRVFSIGTVGCNFGCKFCQNWALSQCTRNTGLKGEELTRNVESLTADMDKWPPQKIVNFCIKYHIPMIAYTYNEPAIFHEYAYDTAVLAKKKGIKNIYVSNGFESKEALDKLKDVIDAFNIDLKSSSAEFYKKVCFGRIEPVKENIKRIFDMKKWIEITTLVIPGKNDSDKELKQIAEFIKNISPNIPWHVTAFHPCYNMLDVPSTPPETLFRAYKIGKKAGLNYVYVGNILDSDKEYTFCPKCKKAVIERFGLTLSKNSLKDGRCPHCKAKVDGVWK